MLKKRRPAESLPSSPTYQPVGFLNKNLTDARESLHQAYLKLSDHEHKDIADTIISIDIVQQKICLLSLSKANEPWARHRFQGKKMTTSFKVNQSQAEPQPQPQAQPQRTTQTKLSAFKEEVKDKFDKILSLLGQGLVLNP